MSESRIITRLLKVIERNLTPTSVRPNNKYKWLSERLKRKKKERKEKNNSTITLPLRLRNNKGMKFERIGKDRKRGKRSLTEDGRKGSTFNIIPISFTWEAKRREQTSKRKGFLPHWGTKKRKRKKREKVKKKRKKTKREEKKEEDGTNVCIPNENCNAINLLTRTR